MRSSTRLHASHGEEFFGSFSEGAWLRPGRWLVDNVVLPYATVFAVALVLFEGVAAIAILTRGGFVQPALVVGAAFATAAAVVSSPGGTIANLGLAAAMVALAVTR
ncbi:MAG: hypothetical protein ACE5GC_07345 [Acidimicrobiia bacterium]